MSTPASVIVLCTECAKPHSAPFVTDLGRTDDGAVVETYQAVCPQDGLSTMHRFTRTASGRLVAADRIEVSS